MVRCCNCGFLALLNSASRSLKETDAHSRESGLVPQGFSEFPVCFVQAAQLDQEMGGNGKDRFLAMIRRERNCPKFIEWEQGYSPQQHAEMVHERLSREWQESREEKARVWQERQEAERRSWQERQEAERRSWEERRESETRTFQANLQLKSLIATGIITLVAALISGGIGYYLSRTESSLRSNGEQQQSLPASKR